MRRQDGRVETHLKIPLEVNGLSDRAKNVAEDGTATMAKSST